MAVAANQWRGVRFGARKGAPFSFADNIQILRQNETTKMKLTHLLLIAFTALSLNAAADEPKAAAQPVRNILEKHDQSGVAGKEIVIGTATLPPGSAIGYHTHPGDEAGYVLKGNLILKTQGQPDRALKAGDSFFNPRGAVHSLV